MTTPTREASEVLLCGDLFDRFPCQQCKATRPVECPHYNAHRFGPDPVPDLRAEALASISPTPPAAGEGEAGIARLQAFADTMNIWEAYHEFRSPMHTMAGDVRHFLATLRPSPDAIVEALDEYKVEAKDDWDRGWNAMLKVVMVRLPNILSTVAALATPEGRTTDKGETFATINQWCDDTFGPATVERIISRAKEEFDELEAVASDPAKAATEAADVCIILCRIPGFEAALQAKMAVNRKRQWKLMGDGSGYHVATLPSDQGSAS